MGIHPNKIINVESLSDSDRYDYFVRKVADFNVVWGLFKVGWATSENIKTIAVPFWPEKDFAERCSIENWSGFEPKPIPLDEFLSKWLPGMQSDNRVCQVFPTRESQGFVVTPAVLRSGLIIEASQYLQLPK